MDLIVTTDNGVMNLAGALGVKTFGLFNTITEWRWFKTTGDDIAWYKSIKPFQCPTSKAWEVPVGQVIEEIRKLTAPKTSPKAAKTTAKVSKTTTKSSEKPVEKKTAKPSAKKTSSRNAAKTSDKTAKKPRTIVVKND